MTDVKQAILNSKVFGNKWDDRAKSWRSVYDGVASRVPEPESLLNIGVGPGGEAERWLRFIHNVFPSLTSFTNLEIDAGNKNKLRKTKNVYVSNVDLGDVRKIDEYYEENSFDIIFWSHGPEHIKREEWKDTFAKLDEIAKEAIIIQCPWGGGYDFSIHHVSKSIVRDEFERHGYTCFYSGLKDTKNADIFGYKLV